MQINKEKLIEDLQDTISNNFQKEVIEHLFWKYADFTFTDGGGDCGGDYLLTESQFNEAMHEFLDMVINFIKSAKS